MEKAAVGRKGEDFAAQYYRKLGYAVKQMNYHSRYGEIDLIAENELYTAFVEVKTRDSSTRISPREAVDYKKQQKLSLTALGYMQETSSEKMMRFDVFEVWMHEGRIYKFNCIENAFEPSEMYNIF